MAKKNIKSISLSELKKIKQSEKLFHNPKAPETDILDSSFWQNVEIYEAPVKKSVHLRLDADIFDFFSQQGKGHISRMQAVLRSYVDAHKER